MNAAASGPKAATLRLLAWGRLWSPLAADDEHREAWQALGLPGEFAAQRVAYWNTFHAGTPQPPVTLLLHALLGREGGSVREDLMRAADYLGLEGGERRLPPDHLAPACEVFALAIEREEPVLVAGLRERYLAPWAAEAAARLADLPPMLALVQRFAADIAA